MQKLFIFLLVITGGAIACNNSGEPSASSGTSTVDSAARAAADTLRPSTDTTARKDVRPIKESL
ncbi:MAG TPA: hypothetical protein VL832_05150 [Puia sp.]|jgi:hypothetical protein|nr:hypothetical protein [Puia sp.]